MEDKGKDTQMLTVFFFLKKNKIIFGEVLHSIQF